MSNSYANDKSHFGQLFDCTWYHLETVACAFNLLGKAGAYFGILRPAKSKVSHQWLVGTEYFDWQRND